MKRILIYIITVVASIYTANAQGEKTLLWEIGGQGLAKPSYIFGTIHLLCPNDFVINEVTKKAFAQTGQLCLELDFDDPSFMTEIQKTMVFTDGKTLKDYMSEADYKTVDEYFTAKLGVGLTKLNTMKPVTLISMFYMALLSCQLQSYEIEFAKMATAEKKEIIGLESVAYQMAIFDKIPNKVQMEHIVDMVKKQEDAAKEFRQLIQAYKDQDMNAMLKLLDSSVWNFKAYENDLLYNRNAEWISPIEKMIKTKPTFIAVGAAHLGGEKGILALLRAKGYSVRPVYK